MRGVKPGAEREILWSPGVMGLTRSGVRPWGWSSIETEAESGEEVMMLKEV